MHGNGNPSKTILMALLLATGCTRAGPPGAGQNPDAGSPPDKELGAFEPVRGTTYLRVAPIRPSGRDGKSCSWSPSSSGHGTFVTYNYVFLDLNTETFVRLLPTNSWHVVGRTDLPETAPGASDPPATSWFLYEIVKADTNADRVLSHEDQITLALSNAAGGDYTELIADADEVHTKVMKDPTTLLVIYRKEGRSHLARVDLKSRQVVNTSELPPFGPDVR
jgi:hypothetical protein